jgi:hypothetical protein
MQNTTAFLAGLGATLAISLAAVAYLRGRLAKILTELCGTEDRAAFWTTFTSLLLMVIPAIFALHFFPRGGAEESWGLVVSRQIEWGLIGLAATLVIMGRIIRKSIPRVPAAKPLA